jgi:hypothetical protein
MGTADASGREPPSSGGRGSTGADPRETLNLLMALLQRHAALVEQRDEVARELSVVERDLRLAQERIERVHIALGTDAAA